MTLDTMGRRTTVSWLLKALGSSKSNSWTQWRLKREAEFMVDKGSQRSFIQQPFAWTQAWVRCISPWDTLVSRKLPRRVPNRGSDRLLKSALKFPVFGEQEGKLSAEICAVVLKKGDRTSGSEGSLGGPPWGGSITTNGRVRRSQTHKGDWERKGWARSESQRVPSQNYIPAPKTRPHIYKAAAAGGWETSQDIWIITHSSYIKITGQENRKKSD